MDDCQSLKTVEDKKFSPACYDAANEEKEVSVENAETDENVVVEKEYQNVENSDGRHLTDNFSLNLLSNDSTDNATISEQKVEIHKAGGNNVVSEADADDDLNPEKENTVIDFEMQNCEQSQVNVVLASDSVISPDDKFEVTIEGNDVATSKPEIEINKLVEDVASVADVEESCTENESKIDCELINLEQNQAEIGNEKLEIQIIKEFVIEKNQQSCVQKEQPVENTATDTLVKTGYRCESDLWTDDEDSSTSDSSSSDSAFFQEMCEKSKPKKLPFVKTRGELALDDLPPIEDLVISVNEGEMTSIGKVYAVVEKLVVIRALKGMKALDLDSVLFLSHDQPLGRVFDVFGPVNEPFYSVRFNTIDQINEKGVKIGTEVFFAPEKSDITSYVFVEKLQNQKGSDASWKHNNEPPEEFLDYSDDEKEKSAKRQRRFKNRNWQINNSSDAPAKRPLLADGSSNYIPPPKPAPQWSNSQNNSVRISRSNPFQSRNPQPSPSPSICSLMSPTAVRNPFNSSPNQRRFVQPQNILYRSSPQLLVSPYQQPHVFGQMAILNHLSPALHAPSPIPSPVMNNIPAFIPASPFSTPQNYFNQPFPRSPSPAAHTQHMPQHIDPWLSNRSPHSANVPPSHPLTVQIPNMNGPSLPVHQFHQERGPMQQFVNIQNSNFNEPFVNNNRNFFPGNMQTRFYRS